MDLKDKVAIITGASRGFGAHLAVYLANRGCRIVCVYNSDNSQKNCQDVVDKIKKITDAISVQADVSDGGELIVNKTIEAFGSTIDILINNAGISIYKPLQEITMEDYDKVFSVNVRGVLSVTKAVIPYLPAGGNGRIINIGSINARGGFPTSTLYASSKVALEGFTRTWAAELGSKGHTVNTVNAGPIENSGMYSKVPEIHRGMLNKMTPLENRAGTPDEISQVVGFLCSSESKWITGQAISASGGMQMY